MKIFPKISIALCTNNGGKFLKNQLQSIENQTLIANEIIICDDNSTDNTIEIIQEFNTYEDLLNGDRLTLIVCAMLIIFLLIILSLMIYTPHVKQLREYHHIYLLNYLID